MRRAFLTVLALLLLSVPAAPARQGPAVLPSAHAHNDYEHDRPLLDALDNGFCSVEADVFLVDGELLVAHDRDKVQKGRTLQKLYLDPLRERVRANGGRVHKGGPAGVILLVDIKADAAEVYPALKRLLAGYREMLTRFRRDGRVEEGAVTVILSGDRPTAAVFNEEERLVGIDGRLPDLDASLPAAPHLYPLVSDAWPRLSSWRGEGPLPEGDAVKLREAVAKAKRRGVRLRFWGIPDVPAAWAALRDAGVDLIGTDDLAGLRAFLTGGTPAPTSPAR